MTFTVKATNLPSPHAREGCRQCSCIDGYLARYIKTNGSTAIRWVCDWCDDYQTAGDLPRSILVDIELEQLPVRLTGEMADGLLCVVCGERPVEYHHFAPLVLFPDWPEIGAYLCVDHHAAWHQTLRRNGLTWPGE